MTTQTLEQPAPRSEEVLEETKGAKEKKAELNEATEVASKGEKEAKDEKEGEAKEGSPDAKGSEAGSTAEAEADKAKGVWIVRIPRVDVDNTKQRTLEAELEGLNKQVIALNAIIRVKRVEKEGAYQRTNAARDKLKVSSAASREKIEELAPYREKVKLQQEQVRAMRDIGKDLQCKTEEELMSRIEALEHSIAHGSMTLNEEKDLVKKIKKLKLQKDSIKEYDTNKETLAETKQEIDEFRDYLKVLNSELDILKFRENGHREVFLKHKAEEDKISESLTELIKERNELKASSDECYERVKKERSRTRKLIAEFSKFRQTRSDLKKLIESEKFEEAVTLGKSSVETWFKEKWNADKSYRDKYVSNMVKHRHKKASIEEIESELNASASSGKSKKREARREAAQRPEDIVAALLEEANQDWIESKKAKAPVVIEVEEETQEEAEPPKEKPQQEAPPKAKVAVRVKAKAAAPPKVVRKLEIDETLVAGFELPSVVQEIISDNTKAAGRPPVQVYSSSQSSSATRAQKKARKQQRKARKQQRRREEEARQEQAEEEKEERRVGEEQSRRRAGGEQEERPGEAREAREEGQGQQQQDKPQLKRVKKNGKIVFVPSDHKPEKPLVNKTVQSYVVPALVGVATIVGSLAGGVYYAYTNP
ncbi:hypothetical protein HOP50_03g25160 [Chloropicon primus]|uniref:Uncharacterized protein n=1 Tax=Chloropicon primus TaxID=1764295 RepID=A0A5B8MH20_9CHLO|nr:hypothetical protein A3770_03p25160 [Chloropicon primus]UPQ99209.1 hypothetical protein HOP50_03g25160 [Chloropicon primus]|eukprot:QDZ19998.1 hypothetical protein A3770_03p25160 [Chloropicon primus]